MAQRQQITLVLFTILYTACTHYCRTLFHHDTVGENVDYVKWRQRGGGEDGHMIQYSATALNQRVKLKTRSGVYSLIGISYAAKATRTLHCNQRSCLYSNSRKNAL